MWYISFHATTQDIAGIHTLFWIKEYIDNDANTFGIDKEEETLSLGDTMTVRWKWKQTHDASLDVWLFDRHIRLLTISRLCNCGLALVGCFDRMTSGLLSTIV